MIAKYGLMDKYQELRDNLINSGTDDDDKKKYLDKIEKVEGMIVRTNNTLKDLYSGDDITSLVAMEELEQEFLYYSITIDMMNAVVNLANTTPNRRIPKLIDQQIEEADVDMLSLNIFNFLGHLPDESITKEDYEIAQMLALEKMYDEQMIETWYGVEKVAKASNHHAIEKISRQYILLMKENLASYDILAKISFNGSPSPEFKALIREEIEAIKVNNDSREELKQDVIAKFNKKIGERLDKQKNALVVESRNIRSLYDRVLNNVITEVKSDKERNEYTLLNILYNQTVALDVEYKQKDLELRELELEKNQNKKESE